MDKELQDLKSVLRSLVVSSPAQVDVRSLTRDYRVMMGAPIPLAKYGYRDILSFLRERCGDCFLGLPTNPVLTLIVPDTLKHIDQFVQRQKPTAVTKMKGKRRSVEQPTRRPEKPQLFRPTNMITQTFQKTHSSTQYLNQRPEVNSNDRPPEVKSNYHQTEVKSNYKPQEEITNYRRTEVKANYHPPEVKANYHPPEVNSNRNPPEVKSNRYPHEVKSNYQSSEVNLTDVKSEHVTISSNRMYNKTKELAQSMSNAKLENKLNSNSHREEKEYNGNVGQIVKKRVMVYDSLLYLDREECSDPDKASSKGDNDSGRQTSSSQSSTKKIQLEELKCEVHQLIKEHENGILCTDILRLYRERYSRELNLSRFGHNNINSLLCTMDERVTFAQEARGVRVRDARAHAPPATTRARAPPNARAPPTARAPPAALHDDPDDALPGIDFEPDVFPADCMHFMESIPALSLDGICTGAMLEVTVGEVYSPSHFWLQRLGPDHSGAMDDVMDEMSVYYNSGSGRSRALARGAVRPGHYCASVYERDWHRSLIVKVLDADTVKVRHVDYGTVDTVQTSSLKPLLRRWAALPAQGLRARLAGLRPGAGGRRWPHAAAAHFLHLVRDRRFVANVVAVDPEEDTVETFLIDTSGADDVCVSNELIRAGHADARPDSALRSGECYLYPRFEALESGATPNYGEIHRYLADGISLEYVEAYRRHVPAAVPSVRPAPAPPGFENLNRAPLLRLESPPAAPSPTSPPPPPTPPPLEINNRVPLLRLESPPPPAGVASLPAAPDSRQSSPPRPAARSPEPAPRPDVSVSPHRVPRPEPGAPASGVGTGAGEVRLTLEECDMYAVLNALDPAAAHCYMLTTLRRAAAQAAQAALPAAQAAQVALPHFTFDQHTAPRFSLNPQAPEFHAGLCPLPGYGPPPPNFGPLPPAFGPPPPTFGPPPPAFGPPSAMPYGPHMLRQLVRPGIPQLRHPPAR